VSNAERLVWPLAVSVALHLGLAVMLSIGSEAHLPRKVKAITLTVFLAGKDRSEPVPIAAPAPVPSPPIPSVPSVPSAPPGSTEASGTVTLKARFLVDPDLSVLEEIPVPVAGSLTIRLHVSALGTVDRVTVMKSDPVPKELLDGVLSRLQKARLAPALAGSEAVASTVDLVIRFEPGLMPLSPNH
jgi:outer membrane biosynthesis protein TonB